MTNFWTAQRQVVEMLPRIVAEHGTVAKQELGGFCCSGWVRNTLLSLNRCEQYRQSNDRQLDSPCPE